MTAAVEKYNDAIGSVLLAAGALEELVTHLVMNPSEMADGLALVVSLEDDLVAASSALVLARGDVFAEIRALVGGVIAPKVVQ